MPKKSVQFRNAKRIDLVNKHREKRNELRKAVKNIHLGEEARWEAMQALQKLPRDSSPSRRRNRCKSCNRPRAYNRLTGLCRAHMRTATVFGMVPGMHKASW